MRSAWLLAAALACGGCAGSAPVTLPRTFDLGIGVPGARLAGVRVMPVRAAAPFDGVEMQYRLAWRNAAELSAFAQSRWAAPPGELLRKQLLRASGEGIANCALEIELQEFSQVFASQTESEARLEVRAQLLGPKGRLGARSIHVSEPGAGADATGGVAALSRATDRMTGELAAWIASQPDCR
jgi:cholesterol transport system auxiliary component